MPYTELPAGFRDKHPSVWVDIHSSLFDPRRAHHMYNDFMDELEYAADRGFDAVCVNEHHSNGYGLMPSPNLIASSLARRTTDTAICVMGNSLALYNPPTRVAEEFAMIDCISGGRLIAGFPVGSPMDTCYAYGQNPSLLRDRYHEAHDLILRAWTDRDTFAFNGRFNQQRYVNIWPRPIQQPHPPIWIPGSGSASTVEFVVDRDDCFCHLSYAGTRSAQTMGDYYWDTVAKRGRDANPYRFGFLQLVGVSETDVLAREEYGPHVEYFFHNLLHTPSNYQAIPGYQDYPSMVRNLREPLRERSDTSTLTAKDFVDRGFLIAGSPATVRDQLIDGIKRLRIGHLMVLLHFGTMSHELCMKNIDLFCREVLPALEGKLATTPEQKASCEEFGDRLRYRLNTRDIIDKTEYDRRFRKKADGPTKPVAEPNGQVAGKESSDQKSQ
jgi:alkanesulfonate monooxygenase SsuD/methylene tetrahydromethanopterin reductase-like flavin-dependent oxidoreductase (luciferase family)